VLAQSAFRYWVATGVTGANTLGFRAARVLVPPADAAK
jgi:hypothetical protein